MLLISLKLFDMLNLYKQLVELSKYNSSHETITPVDRWQVTESCKRSELR